MTSAINPNNINGAYPVAGQDNNSQGFRDNFTNTSTNFQYAADEISDLQSKAVLKQALTGTVLDNDMLGSPLSNALLSNMSENIVALGTVSGTTVINYALASYQTLTTNGAVTLSFTNFPAAGAAASVVVQVTVANPIHTLVLPAAVSVNNTGIQGLNTSTNTISFGTATTPTNIFPATYSFEFSTSNGGSTITVREVNKRLQPFNNSSETLTDTANVNLAVTTSQFSTVTSTTAQLLEGVPGQIKTLAMYADSGNMVITVSNAGWKSTGTGNITFSNIGEACTLQYINSNVANIAASKWFCIGNNGCVFS
jgi:hypothetical protein